METNEAGINLIKSFESLKLKAYLCPAGVWTIGYGHTAGVAFGQTITEGQADRLLKDDVSLSELHVLDNVKVFINDNQLAALVSFVFNVGPTAFRRSTLLRKLNEGNYDAVPSELMRWNKAKGKVLAGLTRRRQAEADLWSTPVSC